MKLKFLYVKRLWVYIIVIYIGIIFIIYILQLSKVTNSNEYSHSFEAKEKLKYESSFAKLNDLNIRLDSEKELEITSVLKADSNRDGMLNEGELSSWIQKKVKQHIILSLKENVLLFTKIDSNPKNGEVSWQEYRHYYLKRQGFSEDFIKLQGFSLKGMPRQIKEEIMRSKAAWSEAARDDPFSLSLDEFLAFRHPESSHTNIAAMVEQTLSLLDINDDESLSENEFSDPDMNKVPGNLTLEEFRSLKRDEFRTIVDENGDGKAERKELLKYFDPRSSHHSTKEAQHLLVLADRDRNGLLSLQEVLNEKFVFIVSKMVDVARSFHDEF